MTQPGNETVTSNYVAQYSDLYALEIAYELIVRN